MNHSIDKPLVSIITPSYNQGRFIEETIKSVLNQDYPNIEYIVIDGGSTDNTIDILIKYEGRLRWVSEPDKGQSDAITKGFAMARGSMMAWLNSDDTYLPGTVNKVVDLFCSQTDIGLIYGKAYFIDIEGNVIGRYPTEPFDYNRLAIFNFICQPATFFRKEALDEVGILDINLHYVMDYDLWIRMANKNKFAYLPEFLATYRFHEESKTISPSDAVSNHEETLKIVMKYYGWAPLNRVYGYCYHRLKSKISPGLAERNILIVLLSVIYSFSIYLSLNKRIKLYDLKMINRQNLSKLFKKWIDIYKGY